MSPAKQFKVIIVGAANVGKTCLLALFTHDTCKRHLDHYIPTTGIDFCPKSFEIDGETYNFHFVDVSGIGVKPIIFLSDVELCYFYIKCFFLTF